MNIIEDKILMYTGIESGQKVYSGFGGQKLTAPDNPGSYSLYEVYDKNSCTHIRFEWARE